MPSEILNEICLAVVIVGTFIHQIAFAKRQRRDLSVFNSSCHLSICLPYSGLLAFSINF